VAGRAEFFGIDGQKRHDDAETDQVNEDAEENNQQRRTFHEFPVTPWRRNSRRNPTDKRVSVKPRAGISRRRSKRDWQRGREEFLVLKLAIRVQNAAGMKVW